MKKWGGGAGIDWPVPLSCQERAANSEALLLSVVPSDIESRGPRTSSLRVMKKVPSPFDCSEYSLLYPHHTKSLCPDKWRQVLGKVPNLGLKDLEAAVGGARQTLVEKSLRAAFARYGYGCTVLGWGGGLPHGSDGEDLFKGRLVPGPYRSPRVPLFTWHPLLPEDITRRPVVC